jgi:hypothetical protein
MFALILPASVLLGCVFAHGGMAVETANFLPLPHVLCLLFHAFLGLSVSVNLFRIALADPDHFRDAIWFQKERVEKLYLILSFLLYATIFASTIVYSKTIAFTTSFEVHFAAYHVVTPFSVLSAIYLRIMLHDRDILRTEAANRVDSSQGAIPQSREAGVASESHV